MGVALLGDPELVLLDEPTSALDPVGRVEVRDIVRAARDRGATVILNSHLLTEVEQVCDRVVIVNRGRIVAAGTLDEVIAGDGVRIRVTGLEPLARAGLAALGPMQDDGEWLTFRPLDPERIPEVVAAIVASGGRVHAVEPGRGSLEARFLELVAAESPTGTPIDDRHRPTDDVRAGPTADRLGPGRPDDRVGLARGASASSVSSRSLAPTASTSSRSGSASHRC